tara:strand:+ start:2065 stop:2625 length:561 start_codon:yes stop_codon:yes gene_type:complete
VFAVVRHSLVFELSNGGIRGGLIWHGARLQAAQRGWALKKVLITVGAILLGLFGFAAAGALGKFGVKALIEEYEESKQNSVLVEGQRMAAEQLRRQLPIRLDEVTVLQAALSADEALIYVYRMDLSKKEMMELGFEEVQKKNLIINVCGQKQMRQTLGMGGEYVYQYFSNDGINVAEIRIIQNDCN